jgi:hypothetical protein
MAPRFSWLHTHEALAIAYQQLAADAATTAWASGTAMTLDTAVSYAWAESVESSS